MNQEQEPQDLNQKLISLSEQEERLAIEKAVLLNKALKSDDTDSIYKAQRYLKNQFKGNNTANVNSPTGQPFKSLILDPQTVSNGGYKDKPLNVSFDVLRAMSKIPIIKAIIETRKEQVLSFCDPQKDKYSTGFVIRPKKAENVDGGIKLNSRQEKRVEELTQFILNCGDEANRWHGDNFHSFARKFIQDCLTLDQGTFEVIRNRRGEPTEFLATDGATYRVADTYNNEQKTTQDKEVDGHLPFYVQVHQGAVVAEFYPWELCFAIRNPQSNIYSNGYGRSELEDLMETITSMLQADQYNSNYFKVGSNPKGILKVTGNVNQGRIEEFRAHWANSVAGSRNAHKLPIIEAEKMDFISTQASNKDMEFAKYQEYLIKISCAIFKMDPSEIGFPMAGSSEGNQGLGGDGGNESKLEYSKDKGLKPLLKSFQQWLNKYVMGPKTDDEYELLFLGLETESPAMELDNDIKAVSNWATVNEIRRKRQMKDIEGGDVILNPIFLQAQQVAMQGNPESNQFVSGQQDYQDSEDQEKSEDPFMKGLQEDIERILTAE